MRQTAEALEVRGYAVTYSDGAAVVPVAVGWDHLLYAASGVMSVETDVGTWVVPPHRALWVPDGRAYSVQMHGRVAVRTLYFRTELGALPAELRVVNVSDLLRELIVHAIRISPLDRRVLEHAHVIDVVLDQLAQSPDVPLQLPQPKDPRARALVALLAESPTATIEQLARDAGASRRTLERLFVADTGMPIAQWRRQLRLVQALRLLGAGHQVTDVAHRVGYATPSAFTAMFRAELGTTPTRHVRRRAGHAATGDRPRAH